MLNKFIHRSPALLILALTMTNTGCAFLSIGVDFGPFGIPIPVTPYLQDKKEDEFWNHERYERVPILGPVTSEGPAVALDAPSDDEVIRALERALPIEGGVPLLFEKQRNNV